MGSRNYFLYIIIVLLILVNILIIGRHLKQVEALKKSIKNCASIKEQYQILSRSIDYRVANTVQSEGRIINNAKLDSIDLASKIFLRLNTNGCQACINKIQRSLNKLNEKLKGRIVVIGSFTSKTEYEYYKLNLFKSYIVIDLEDKCLINSVVEKHYQPYFFTIDGNNKIRDVFIPDKIFLFLTDTYLKNIEECTSFQ